MKKVYIDNIKMYSGTKFHNIYNERFMICNQCYNYYIKSVPSQYVYYIIDLDNGNIWGSFQSIKIPMFSEIRQEYRVHDFHMTEEDYKWYLNIEKMVVQ